MAVKERNASGQVTPASIRAVADTGKPANPSKPNLIQVRAMLYAIAAHGTYPNGLNSSSTAEEVCEWFVLFISGEARGKA